MLQLIKVELKKIFHKKSIYVIWGLMTIFCLLNNILYKIDYDDQGNYKYLEQDNLKQEEKQLEEELTKYNKDNQSEVTMYVTIKTKLDLINLKKEFSDNSWQYHQLNDLLYDHLYQLNYYQYIEKNEEKYIETNKIYQFNLQKLKNDDWQYYLKIEKDNLTTTITELKNQLNLITDKLEKIKLENELKKLEFNLKIINYRLSNNIKKDNSYLNNALEKYQENYKIVEHYQSSNQSRTHNEELTYRKSLATMKINQYIIEHKQNINQENNLNYQLRTIIEDYEIFFVILILILSSTILCNEFKEGTIKLLLIKPYSRGKILLSKYFTIVLVTEISILFLIAIQLLIGGVVFGLDSFDLPIVVYDFNKSKLIEYQVISYMLIRIIAKMPFLLLLMTISLGIALVSNSSILALTIPLMIYMFNPSLENLMLEHQLTSMKYLVNMNWDLQDYLFGNLNEAEFMKFQNSLIIIIIYFVCLWILTIQIFKKKNIKNI
mgnify:CR=1 FL=1